MQALGSNLGPDELLARLRDVEPPKNRSTA